LYYSREFIIVTRSLLISSVLSVVLLISIFYLPFTPHLTSGITKDEASNAAPLQHLSQTKPKLVFDYSHGQYSDYVAYIDQYLEQNLTAMGFDIVWAKGGINSTVLQDAFGLIIGSFLGPYYIDVETNVDIQDWFYQGDKFLWVSGDSDYVSPPELGQFINDNMSAILQGVGSHVYPEPTSVSDPISSTGVEYRVVANTTVQHPLFDDQFDQIVDNVDAVLCHDPTCLYGSDSSEPDVGVNPVALDEFHVENVYPLLFYSASAYINDNDLIPPYTHENGETGNFVAATIELNAGPSDDCIIVVSGASPYGDYRPMYADEYYGVQLNGYRFVNQLISYVRDNLYNPPTTPAPTSSYSVVTFDYWSAYQGYLENGITDTAYMAPGYWSESWHVNVEQHALQMIVELDCPTGTDFDLEVFKDDQTFRSNSPGDDNITITSPESGMWTILVDFSSGRGYYDITATIIYSTEFSSSSSSSTSSSSPTTSSPTNLTGYDFYGYLGLTITIGSMAVIIVFAILIIKNRPG
jgi:hypothetical protein